ncbi:hypothetical protein PAPYR_9029 [Paratrimastix pyriformis]|uniref:C-type lectin domain-containing protein n=1 Tax=Paratrimastix pyriformis TaxID=342808 RepID=A0ABQ8UC08_9EUKA|nr:hypothetical protein PAPYR_9029 [Paratrimastix pyriformis]
MKWDAARRFCATAFGSYGTGELASITNTVEWEAVKAVTTNQESVTFFPSDLARLRHDVICRFWIGITRNSLNSDFYWLDGNTSTFRAWGYFQPATTSNYVVMANSKGTGWWYTASSSGGSKDTLCRVRSPYASQCSLSGLCSAYGDWWAYCTTGGTCVCSYGVFGPLCQYTCDQCNHGTCYHSVCHCDSGYTGDTCSDLVATTCPAPVLTAGQVVLSGCGANAAVGSTCTLGCAWGYYPAPGASQGTGQCTQTDVGTAGYPTINLHCDV